MTRRWMLGIRKTRQGLPFVLDIDTFQLLTPPNGFCYADPFLVCSKDRTIICFEQFQVGNYFSGEIWMIEVLEHSFSYPVRVLSPGYHISYPQVVEYHQKFFMLPETRQDRSVKLFLSKTFPTGWVEVFQLFRNVEAVDSTLLLGDDGVHLYSWIPKPRDGGELAIYYSETLLGNWSHKRVAYDGNQYRPAGLPFTVDGKRFRASQISRFRYGDGVCISEIIEANESGVSERHVVDCVIKSKQLAAGVHTYNRTAAFEVIDIWVEG